MRKLDKSLLLTVVLLIAAGLFALAPQGTPQAAAQMSKDTPDAAAIWKEMKKLHYEQWAPWPGQDTGFYPGESPHGKKLKLFINRTTFGDLGDPPFGSIIVKENYSPDEELTAVTIMKRIEGYDSKNNDWYWAKYKPDGSVAMRGDTKVAGRVQSCNACHSAAEGGDYIFTNDEKEHHHGE
jgi:hypothetical protein